MAKVDISVVIKSKEPVKVVPGDFRYTHTVIPKVGAIVEKSGFAINDNQSINQEVNQNGRLSFIMSNDREDRINRISHVLYLGTLYKITSVENRKPRVHVVLGDPATETLKELQSEGVSNE